MRASRWVLGVIGAAVLIAVSGGVYAQAISGAGSAGHWSGPSGPTYNVTFQETGLPAGTNWSVTIFGHFGWGHHFHGGHQISDNSSIVLALPNGTYGYRAHAADGFVAVSGGNGTFVVNGSAPSPIAVTFGKPTTYAVTFSETGLPSGTNWTVRVWPVGGWPFGFRHQHLVQRTSNASLTFNLPNGTFRYFVFPVPGYGIADNGSHGTFNVSGASPATISVAFQKLVTYTVTFAESGLPSGTNWTVVVFSWGPSAGWAHVVRANTTQIVFELTNGTYYFHVHARGYAATNNSSGSLTVDGASPATVQVTFAPWSSTWVAGTPARGVPAVA